MKSIIQLKTITPPLLIILVIACFALSPGAQAVGPEAPDAALPNGNTAEGDGALSGLTGGFYNSAFGFLSLLSNADASFNTGVGAGTLLVNTANNNTATGAGALFSHTTGNGNTANGTFALFNDTSGEANTATGASALFGNTTGTFNTANGAEALSDNTEGNLNTADGWRALSNNTTGDRNTAAGAQALFTNISGTENTAVGDSALAGNSSGSFNTAVGFVALRNTTGGGNTGCGHNALGNNTTSTNNTAVGRNALSSSTGGNNTAVGSGAGAAVETANNVICIGAGVDGADVSDSCYIGNIFNQTSVLGTQVFIDSSNKLGTITSSKRFKEEIKPMNQTSEALYALKPVTFRYKKEIDPGGTSQFGLVAEEVENVNPDLVVRDKDGKAYSVRYDQVNAMLLNEFLKEHKRLQELEATVAQQQRSFQEKFAQQEKQIEALASGLQKVSTQIEISRSAAQMVENNQ
jgi:hypothetical protein